LRITSLEFHGFQPFLLFNLQRSPRCNTQTFNSLHAADCSALYRCESFKCTKNLNPTFLGRILNLKTGFTATLNNRCAQYLTQMKLETAINYGRNVCLYLLTFKIYTQLITNTCNRSNFIW